MKLQDPAGGGFAGAATSDGRAVASAPKGAVLHARVLWTFASAHLRFGEPALLAAADQAYRFIRDRLVDPACGGVIWIASPDGAPVDRRKHLYAQAFAIYGLAAYYRASGAPDALALAQGIWRLIEQHAADAAWGGYFESFSADWQVTPNVLMGRPEAPKSFNAHLHLLEAYGALWEVWPEPSLGTRIDALMALMTGPALDRQRSTFLQFFSADWRALDDGLSYGHDIEASWLVPSVGALRGPACGAAVRVALAGVAGAVVARAVDRDGGVRDRGGARDRIWWVQAEALVGFLDAFTHDGDARFLAAAEGVWGFIQRRVIDRAGGEWHGTVGASDSAPMDAAKAGLWKCPYHNGRACLEVSRAAR